MLTADDYRQAIQAQDACNLSGIVHSWSKMMDKIWEEARALKEGTQWVNRHPINVMFSSKVASLTGSEDFSQFSVAYDICTQRSEQLDAAAAHTQDA